MTYEEFTKVLREYAFNDHQIKLLWDSKPEGKKLDEAQLRKAASEIAPIRDTLIQR